MRRRRWLLLAGAGLSACLVAPAPSAGAGAGLAFAQHRLEAGESSGHVTVQVTRAATDALEESEAWYATAPTGDAVEDVDYLGAQGRVRLGVGQTGASITVFVLGDGEHEAPESFTVRMFGSRDGDRLLDEMTVVIVDDDDPDAAPAGDAGPDASQIAAASTSGAAMSASGSQYVAPRVVTRTRSARAAPARRVTAGRVTPFELQSPGAGSIPAPDHTTPIAAAGILGALLLARVSAELWFRWRIDETQG